MKKRKKSASKKKTPKARTLKCQLDGEVSGHVELARKIMTEHREVLEKLAKS